MFQSRENIDKLELKNHIIYKLGLDNTCHLPLTVILYFCKGMIGSKIIWGLTPWLNIIEHQKNDYSDENPFICWE